MAQVLVVEDDATIRSSIIRGLTDRGHAVASAPTAMAGLEQAVSARPDVVVLDLGLPDLDGTAMLRMLRGVSDVPVVVATPGTTRARSSPCSTPAPTTTW